MFHAIHHDGDRGIEAHVAHILGLIHGWHRIQDILSEDAVVVVRIDGEIPHAEGSEILEEVRALTGIDAVVLQSGLHDDTGGRDMRPLHGDAQPEIAGSPAPRSDKDIVLPLFQEPSVDALYLFCYRDIISRREVIVGLDIHHIGDIVADTMSQGMVGTQQAVVIIDLGEVLIEHLLAVNDRSDLQEVELSRAVVVDITCQLDLYRAPHSFLSVSHTHLQQLGEGQDAMLEETTQRDDLPTTLVVTVTDDLIHRVIRTADISQRTILISLFDTQFLDVEAIVDLEIIRHMTHIEGIEMGLGLAQGQLHLTQLQDLLRVIRTHAQRLSSIHDILS